LGTIQKKKLETIKNSSISQLFAVLLKEKPDISQQFQGFLKANGVILGAFSEFM
jgi:hypothetical protein